MSKQLTQFQKVFKRYMDKFELNHYRVTFCEKHLEDENAQIHADYNYSIAEIAVNTDKLDRDPHRVAKHEAIHLLLAKFSGLGEQRHLSKSEYLASEEELVRKLEWLIPDVKEK